MGWSLKKWVFDSGGWTKYRLLVTQGIYFLEKYDGLSELVAFGHKSIYFTGQNGPKK